MRLNTATPILAALATQRQEQIRDDFASARAAKSARRARTESEQHAHHGTSSLRHRVAAFLR
jgi:hypothetical protein